MSMRTYDASAYASTPAEYQPNADPDDSVSVFDRYSSFDGTFNLTRDLRVEGQVKGTISCKGTLYVSQGATVDANIDAENITVAGDLTGEVTCRGRLQILASGKVHGKISTVTLVINEGAIYQGELVMESGQDYGAASPRSIRARNAATPPVASSDAEPAAVAGQTPAGGNTFIRRFGGQESAWEAPQNNEEEGEQSS
jgi:cytoskeletal protein CcmA (bactofilin family)